MAKKKADDPVLGWQTCAVNNLAGQFHQFDNESQYTRLEYLFLDPVDMYNNLFPPKDKTPNMEISSFTIRLALDKNAEKKKKFAFKPRIIVNYLDLSDKKKPKQRSAEGQFEYEGQTSLKKNATEIPSPLKDSLCRNWKELDVSLIDDVFVASVENGKSGIAPVRKPSGQDGSQANRRLLSYHYSPDNDNRDFWSFINDHRGRIYQFIFHLGVDMNKFHHKDQFSFSPIFEVHVSGVSEQQVHKLRKAGLRCIPTGAPDKVTGLGSEVVYYEYSSPCPSSC